MPYYATFKCHRKKCGHRFNMAFALEYLLDENGVKQLLNENVEEEQVDENRRVSGFLIDYYCPNCKKVHQKDIRFDRVLDRFSAYLHFAELDYKGNLNSQECPECSHTSFRAVELIELIKDINQRIEDLETDLTSWEKSIERKLKSIKIEHTFHNQNQERDLELDDVDLDPDHATLELDLSASQSDENLLEAAEQIDFDEILDLVRDADKGEKFTEELIQSRQTYLKKQEDKLARLKKLYHENPDAEELKPIRCPTCGRASLVVDY